MRMALAFIMGQPYLQLKLDNYPAAAKTPPTEGKCTEAPALTG